MHAKHEFQNNKTKNTDNAADQCIRFDGLGNYGKNPGGVLGEGGGEEE